MQDINYVFFCLSTTAFTTIGTMLSALLLTYTSPLDADACSAFVRGFIDYCGEPIAAIGSALVNMSYACILWMFGVYGVAAGVLAVVTFYICAARVLLALLYFTEWQNPSITSQDRERRIRNADGTLETWKDHTITAAAAQYQMS